MAYRAKGGNSSISRGVFTLIGVFVLIIGAIAAFVFLNPGRDPDDTYIEVINEGFCPQVQVVLVEVEQGSNQEVSRRRYIVESGESRRIRINYNSNYTYSIDTSYGGNDELGNSCLDIFEGQIFNVQAGTTTTISIPSVIRPRMVLENVAECPDMRVEIYNAAITGKPELELRASSGATSEALEIPEGPAEGQQYNYILEPVSDITDTGCNAVLTGTFGPSEFNKLYRIHVIQGVSVEVLER